MARPPTCSWSRARTPAPAPSSPTRPLLIGRGSDAAIKLDDDYVSTRHARVAASGDEWFVEDLGSTNGTYVGPGPHHPAHHHRPRRPGPRRQDHPGAAEVMLPPLLRDLRRRPRPPGEPGQRLRRSVAADGLRRRRRCGPRRPRLEHRRPGAAQARPAARRGHPRPGGRRRAPRRRPDRRARRGGPRPQRHLHHRHGRALRRHPLRRRPHRRQPRLPLPPRRAAPAHPRPHLRPVASSTRAGSPRSSRGPTRTATSSSRPLDGIRHEEPDLFEFPAEAGDRVFLCSDGACGTLTARPDGRHPRAPAPPTSPPSSSSAPASRPAAPTTSPASSPTSPRSRRPRTSSPLLVGAAADLPRRLPLGGAVGGAASAATAPATPARSRPCPDDVPDGRLSPPTRSTPRPRATPRAPRSLRLAAPAAGRGRRCSAWPGSCSPPAGRGASSSSTSPSRTARSRSSAASTPDLPGISLSHPYEVTDVDLDPAQRHRRRAGAARASRPTTWTTPGRPWTTTPRARTSS